MTETGLSRFLLGPAPERSLYWEPLLRRGVKLSLDTLAAGLAMAATSAVLRQGAPRASGLLGFLLLAMAINVAFRLYSQHYREVGIEETRAILLGTLVLATVAMAICLVRKSAWPGGEPPEVVLGASLATGTFWVGLRMLCLANHHRLYRRSPGVAADQLAQRTIIVGAGRAGALLCQELQEHPRLRCQVLGFVDDALDKQGVKIHGIPVLGPTSLLPLYIHEQRANQVILGMAGVSGIRLREIADVARGEGVVVKTVPGILDLVGDRPWKPEVRDIAIEDLLR